LRSIVRVRDPTRRSPTGVARAQEGFKGPASKRRGRGGPSRFRISGTLRRYSLRHVARLSQLCTGPAAPAFRQRPPGTASNSRVRIDPLLSRSSLTYGRSAKPARGRTDTALTGADAPDDDEAWPGLAHQHLLIQLYRTATKDFGHCFRQMIENEANRV